MKWVWRIGAALVGLVVVAVAAVVVVGVVLHRPLPEHIPSVEADALARQMMESVDVAAWERTGAVQWTFTDGSKHVGDRQRGLHRYRKGDLVVLYALDTRQGRAWRGETELEGHALTDALDNAWFAFCNDSFWLNPVVKAFDDGTSRSLVTLDDGRSGVLVTYAGGGVTPGDSYLWLLDDTGRPSHWRMWVSILPVGGLELSWDGWVELSTGAWVSTTHEWEVGLTTGISDVRGEATLDGLLDGAADPFAPLFEG